MVANALSSHACTQFETAWREVQHDLTKRARRLCRGDIHHADELLSATALKVYLYLERTPERIRDLQGFMFLVLNHVFLDSTRRQGRENRVIDHHVDMDSEWIQETSSTQATPDAILQLRQELDAMVTAVETLTRDQQHLFTLRFSDELSYSSIAQLLGISEALVRKRVELLRRKLKTHLLTA